ncbi:bifunctional FO biosynthesis protein CofGH [Nocardioides sp. HDW12B]|uniref:bifunctional FO biosynthesis protein CofGH n=1 Tax=Nocardioides sp. HDW12B TaxID=2714939 RepID=UPI0019816E45|nr:bifunctional FO biosynthesis protein CofGH [Nocardioides sp. HDW12B]
MTQEPTPQQVRRALARVRRGVTLDVAEAEALLAARGEDLAALVEAAGRVRDAGLVAAGRPATVTYSPKVFIPLTRLCRDRCHYCTFVTVPGKLAAAGQEPFLSPDEVLAIATQGAALGCAEALFTLGDRPEDRWPEAARWLDEHGYDSTLDYVRAMAVRVLEETGLLPHLNPGVMSWQEINRLKPVSPSMGMMLETTSTRLFTEKGQPHHGSPDKDPAVRLRVLEDAGRLSVPFTSGLLVGIGETLRERAETIFALRSVGRQYGHLQEVIVQNFRAKPDTAMRSVDDLGLDEYVATIAVTRLVLGPTMRVQAPPNLVDLAECRALLAAGIDDWGGVSPLTPDHVNPERPWPSLDRLRDITADSGFTLRPRLTAHASYVRAGDPWIDPRVRPHVAALADDDGYLRPGARPVGLPWQEPDQGGLDAGGSGSGRTDLHETIDTTGRTTDRRSDFEDVYGSWQSLRDQLATQNTAAAQAAGTVSTKAADVPDPAETRASTPEGSEGLPSTAGTRGSAPEGSEGLPATVDGSGPPGATKERKGWLGAGSPSEPSPATPASAPTTPTPPTPLTPTVAAALRQAEKDPKQLTDAQALALFTADAHDLDAVRRLADDMRRDVVGDDVTYVVNRNINFTNVCYTGCRFCAFAQRRTDADAYSLSMEQVADRAEEAWQLGATEVCMQGGIDPELPGTAYFDIAAAVKRRVPQMHVHAFSPMEVVNGASRTGLSIHDWLLKAKESGLDTIPGTAAEILDDDVRWILTKGKLPTSAWVEVVTTAHKLGIRSSATMMYGHVDRPDHWVTHLRVLQRIQDETGGFTEFVPLPFVHTSAPIYLAGVARPGPTLRDNVAVHAAARILLHGRVDNVQTSWVKLGVEGTRLMLRSGCNDLGGTLMEETISRMAGSEHGSAKTVAEITEIADGIGRPVRERTTTYGVRA